MRSRILAALGLYVFLAGAASAQVVNQTVVVGAPGEGPMQMLPPGRQPKTGTSVIRGRVVAADSGAAIRRAQVRIGGQEIGSKSALTDANGRYEFKDLPAGRFTLSVVKAGFVTMQYGQRRPFEPGRPIELSDAQLLEKVDVALPRGSVLAGRVVDEFGEPVADAMVSAMRMQFVNGRRRLVNAGRTGQTNDLGQYRIYGLAPGEYYVSATLRSGDVLMDIMGGQGGPSGSNNNSGYAPTYYPGTPSPAEAQRVSVAVGQELASVDIGLQPVRLARITGTAVASDGKPMSSAMIMLIPNTRDAMMFMPGGTSRTNAAGQFTLSGVAPGEYSLQIRSMGALMTEVAGAAAMVFSVKTDDGPPSASSASSQEAEFASVPLSVSGEDINGLVVTTTHGAHASGRVVFDGGGRPEALTGIRVTAVSADPDGGPTVAGLPTQVKDAGTFELTGLIGTRLVRASGLPKGWYLQSVRFNGDDVTDAGIEFKPGEDVSGIEIHASQQTTTVTGAVTDDRGDAAKDYTVVLFPTDQSKWGLPNNRWLTSARPDQSGQFRATGLPPGSYYAVAVEYVAQGEWSDPDWLQRAKDKATTFTLSDGGAKTLELKMSSF